jgi:hypothetical protein
MPQIQELNKLEKILSSFGVTCKPRQTKSGEICLPILYKGNGFSVVVSCFAGKPTEKWNGHYSSTIQKRVREHFQAFLAVDAL